jgi:hypothetical protein
VAQPSRYTTRKRNHHAIGATAKNPFAPREAFVTEMKTEWKGLLSG